MNDVPQLKFISYEDKLEFYRNVRQWHNKFVYQQFDLSGLKSINLEKNDKFVALKEQLQSFNKQLQQAEATKITPSNFPSRYNLHQQIHQLLREALLSTNKDQQDEFIQKIFEWNNSELSRSLKSRCKHTQSMDLKQESSNFDGTTNDETKRHFLDFHEHKQLPSQMIQENLKDFKCQQRTIHKEIDPPDVRLQSYSRKQLIQSQLQIPQLKQETLTSFFPTQTIFRNNSQLQSDIIAENESEQNFAENKMPIEPVKVYLKDDPDISIQRQQSKSFEIKQTYQSYQPTNSEIEASLQKRWISNRQKEAKTQKEDQEIVNSMLQWSKNKSRIQKEIDRRQDSSQFGSRYQSLEYMPDSPLQTKKQYYIGYDPKVVNLKQLPTIIANTSKNNSVRTMIEMEQSVTKQNIDTTKMKYQGLLNLSSLDLSPQKGQQSLSVYGASDQKNARSLSYKNKISSVLDAHSPDKITEQQLKEVFEIKNRMAKHKIVIPLKKIMTGLVAPTIDKANLYDKIPDIGSMIMSNPFEIPKKTKKKKKKKKE